MALKIQGLEAELNYQKKKVFTHNPLISIIVPTFNTPINFLDEMIGSLRAQSYSSWELCIADASGEGSETREALKTYEAAFSINGFGVGSLKISYLKENLGISGNTNEALSLATGDYLAFLDHDDFIEPDCLFEVVKAINNTPTIDVLYTDEDKVMNGHFYYPNFKPAYNRLLLQSSNYIAHFFVVKKTIVDMIGGFDSACDGSQDYDFILRATNKAAHIYHISRILYHWRVHKDSVAIAPEQKQYCYDAAVLAINKLIKENDIRARAECSENIGFYDTKYALPKDKKLEIIDFSSDLKKDIKTSAADFIIIKGDAISTISPKIEAFSKAYLNLPYIGAVSYKLFYEKKLQSFGATYFNDSVVGLFEGLHSDEGGFQNRALADLSLPLCSTDVFATKKELLQEFMDVGNDFNDLPTFAVAFSIFIHSKKLEIAGIHRAYQRTDSKSIAKPSDRFIKENSESLKKLSELYRTMPY